LEHTQLLLCLLTTRLFFSQQKLENVVKRKRLSFLTAAAYVHTEEEEEVED